MKSKTHILFFIILVFLGKFLFSQNIDSLKIELKKATQDTTQLRIYISLCNECDVKDNLIYAEPAMKLVDKLITNSKNDTITYAYDKLEGL